MLDLNKLVSDAELLDGKFISVEDFKEVLNNYEPETIEELISILDNNIQDDISSYADSKVDIYNYDLREWSVDNYNYIEDAISEFGINTNNPDFHQLIMQGQYYAYSNEYYNLLNEFRNYVETLED